MKLVSLALENFRQHRHTVLEFGAGITGILGPNGSGKTSICEAIAFALYGSRALRGKVDEARTRGVPRDAKLRVELRFEHDGQPLRVVRTAQDAQLFQGGDAVPVAQGVREVTNSVSFLLAMSFEEFTTTYFTEQKGLEFLSGLRGATDRERFVLRMLGFSRFERTQELLREDRRDLKGEIAGAEMAMPSLQVLEERLLRESAEVNVFAEKLKEEEAALRKAEKELEFLQKKFVRLEETRERAQKSEQKVRELEARYAECARTLKREEEERRELQEQLEALERANPSIDPVKLRAEEAALAAELRRLRDETSKLEKIWHNALGEGQAAVKFEKRRLDDLHARLTRFDKLKGEESCPTCGQPLGAERDTARSHLVAETEKVERTIGVLEQKLAEVGVEPPELIELRARIKSQENEQGRVASALETARRFEQLRDHAQRIERSLAEGRQLLETLHADLEQARTELNEQGFNPDEYRKEKGALDAASGFVNVARLQRVRTEGDLTARRAHVERTAQEIEEYHARVEKLAAARKRFELLEKGDELLTDFRREVTSSLRPRLSQLASEFITELTDGRYTLVEVAEDFSATVVEDGTPKAVVSGGEEDILHLAMRLSLSQLLAERAGHAFSLLILDEVFGSLDENRRRNLLELLERLSNRFEQILIISHFEDVKDGVRNLLYLDYQDAAGELSIVEPVEAEATAINF